MIKGKRKPNLAVVLLAGGKGERMGGRYKQFLKIKEKPLLFFSLDKLIGIKNIESIVVVAPREKLPYASSIISREYSDKRISVISGGSTRRESTFRALDFLKNSRKKFTPDYVIFHDAARPFLSLKMIQAVCTEAVRSGAAVVGIKSPDLVLELRGGFVHKAMDKENSILGHTPQCFKFKDILAAHEMAAKNKVNFLEDNIEILKKSNPKVKIKVVEGFYPNLKVTFNQDIKMISSFLL